MSVNAQDEDGNTPLHLASEGLHQKNRNISLSFSNVARLLLGYGADVNAQESNQLPVHPVTCSGAMRDDRGRTRAARACYESSCGG